MDGYNKNILKNMINDIILSGQDGNVSGENAPLHQGEGC